MDITTYRAAFASKNEHFITKLLCFNTYENLVFKNVHYEHYFDANKLSFLAAKAAQ